MKRKSRMLGVLFALIALVSYMAKPEKAQNDLLLMNIEALTAGEDYVPIQCIGTVDCSLGGKQNMRGLGIVLKGYTDIELIISPYCVF